MRGVTVNPVSPANIEAFQLTRLMRGVTRHLNFRNLFLTISTHTPHARRDEGASSNVSVVPISTHTPHARRDKFIIFLLLPAPYFNSHASCEA